MCQLLSKAARVLVSWMRIYTTNFAWPLLRISTKSHWLGEWSRNTQSLWWTSSLSVASSSSLPSAVTGVSHAIRQENLDSYEPWVVAEPNYLSSRGDGWKFGYISCAQRHRRRRRRRRLEKRLLVRCAAAESPKAGSSAMRERYIRYSVYNRRFIVIPYSQCIGTSFAVRVPKRKKRDLRAERERENKRTIGVSEVAERIRNGSCPVVGSAAMLMVPFSLPSLYTPYRSTRGNLCSF